MDSSQLPDYSEAELQPVAPKFRRYLLFSTVMFWAIPLLVSAFSGWLPFVNITLGWVTFIGLAVLVLLILLYRLADARHRGWALREHDLIAQSGVWWRTTTTLPVARIQHVETSSGPVERTMDLARLSCYTAGGMTADLVVIALQAETADRLREHLLEQIRLRDEQDDKSESESQQTEAGDDSGRYEFEAQSKEVSAESTDTAIASEALPFTDTESAGTDSSLNESASKPHD
ncbi:MAG: PH domain-containing protein [Pseudomonadota bacterium]